MELTYIFVVLWLSGNPQYMDEEGMLDAQRTMCRSFHAEARVEHRHEAGNTVRIRCVVGGEDLPPDIQGEDPPDYPDYPSTTVRSELP